MAGRITELKQQYVEYFADVPVQRYAALYISRNEDTIIRWRKNDKAFADAVQRAKAEWIRKKVLATKAEFALERLEKDIFAPASKVDISLESSQLLAERNKQIHFDNPKSRQVIEAFDAWLMENTTAEQG